jgi:murein DD-endopeptidase MepM/ murein hydrolase activator NlpD
MPMKFKITSEYGVLEEIRHGRAHTGVDLAMPRGTELHSIAEGTIERVVNNSSLGKGVYVRTDNGDVHLYGHLDSVKVRVGEHVDKGDLLGFSGSTGHSTGPHLHFSLLHNGHYVDPSDLTAAVQHYSGEIAGPSILGIDGPASWVVKKAAKHILNAETQVIHSIRDHILNFLYETSLAIVELSYGIALVGTATLIILGVMGLRNGYRWSSLTFGVYTLIRLLGGGLS